MGSMQSTLDGDMRASSGASSPIRSTGTDRRPPLDASAPGQLASAGAAHYSSNTFAKGPTGQGTAALLCGNITTSLPNAAAEPFAGAPSVEAFNPQVQWVVPSETMSAATGNPDLSSASSSAGHVAEGGAPCSKDTPPTCDHQDRQEQPALHLPGSAVCYTSLASPTFALHLANDQQETHWRFRLHAARAPSSGAVLELAQLPSTCAPGVFMSAEVKVELCPANGSPEVLHSSTMCDHVFRSPACSWGMVLPELRPAGRAHERTAPVAYETADAPQPPGGGKDGRGDDRACRVTGQQLRVTLVVSRVEPAAAEEETSAEEVWMSQAGQALAADAGTGTGSGVPTPRLLSDSPSLLLVEDFLDPGTCDGLMALATPGLMRSRVASGTETPSRTSSTYFFVKEAAEHPLVKKVEERVSALFADPLTAGTPGGQRRPVERTEALQVVRYLSGEFYHEHYDNKGGVCPTRDATIIIYLNQPAQGGTTRFPQAKLLPRYQRHQPDAAAASGTMPRAQTEGRAALVGIPHVEVAPEGSLGIDVYPVKGRAVVFWSTFPSGDEDTASIHAALPLIECEKWIATRWMRHPVVHAGITSGEQ